MPSLSQYSIKDSQDTAPSAPPPPAEPPRGSSAPNPPEPAKDRPFRRLPGRGSCPSSPSGPGGGSSARTPWKAIQKWVHYLRILFAARNKPKPFRILQPKVYSLLPLTPFASFASLRVSAPLRETPLLSITGVRPWSAAWMHLSGHAAAMDAQPLRRSQPAAAGLG